MGLSTKQVSGDGFDWGQSLLHPDNSLELLPEPPPLPPPPVTSARRQPPQQQPEQLPCPRCASTNTKFCYYNNYNKSQPRHFCKACKRHWTKGGTLRNVPVGGGRKNKRHKTSNAAATTSKSNTHMGIQKNMSEFHYQGLNLIPPPPPPPASSAHDNFFSSFESNPSSISASFRCSDAYNFTGGLDFIEDTTITTAAAAAIMATATTTTTTTTASIGSQPWQAVPTTTTNGTTDMPNYWNWDDFESLVTSTEINIPWDDDDTEIKP